MIKKLSVSIKLSSSPILVEDCSTVVSGPFSLQRGNDNLKSKGFPPYLFSLKVAIVQSTLGWLPDKLLCAQLNNQCI